jgi:hypothetical protein
MLIALRMLKLIDPAGSTDVPVRIHLPVQQGNSWYCRFEIDWPDGTLSIAAGGVDAVQAIDLALRIIGATLYASDHHASGRLVWEVPGEGYGFPVPNVIRDLLSGDDAENF